MSPFDFFPIEAWDIATQVIEPAASFKADLCVVEHELGISPHRSSRNPTIFQTEEKQLHLIELSSIDEFA